MGRKKLDAKDFFNRTKNPNYNFSISHYVDLDTPIEVICNIHGLFSITPRNMLYKEEGCKFCGLDKMSKTKSFTNQQFINKVKRLYDCFDYSLVNYKNNKTKIKIICKKCGETFEVYPHNFLNGHLKHKCNVFTNGKTDDSDNSGTNL